MTAIAQAASDPKPRNIGVVLDMIAGEAIKAGQVVGFHGTGVAWTVWRHVTGTTVAPLGVALYSAASGAHVAVAGPGSIAMVKNAIDSALDGGTQLMGSGTTEGHVIAASDAAAAEPFGMMMETLPATTVMAYAYIFGPINMSKTA